MSNNSIRTLAELQQQAEAGSAEAQFELAHCLSIAALSSSAGLDNNIAPALTWLDKSAETGYAEAQFSLGLYWLCNQYDAFASVELKQWAIEKHRSKAKEIALSLILTNRWISVNLDEARNNLQYLFLDGDEGIKKNLQSKYRIVSDDKAFRWLTAAAQQGHSEAAFFREVCYPENIGKLQNQDAMLMRLANAYMTGRNDIAPNPAIALQYFEELAKYSEDDSLAGEANFKIAENFFEEKRYQTAIGYLRAAIKFENANAHQKLEKAFLNFTFSEFYSCKNSDQFYEYACQWLLERLKDDPYDRAINFALGTLFAFGKGVCIDNAKAINCFEIVMSTSNVGEITKVDSSKAKLDALGWFAQVYMNTYGGKSGEFLIAPGVSSYFTNDAEHSSHIVLPSLTLDYYQRNNPTAIDEFNNKIKNKEKFDCDNNYLKLFDIQNKNLLHLQNKMQKLVEQFTHTLGNVIFPDTIYQVAERLKTNPECRKDVLLLNEAYHSEIIIKLQAELLRQRYANSNPEKFRQMIRDCRQSADSGYKIKSIADILDYAASRVMARFLNQHNASLGSIRDKILAQKNVSLDALRQQFEDDILLNKTLGSVEWINQHLRPFEVVALSPLWQKVYILAESHAEALLFGYFSEVLFNAFKYADHDAEKFLTVRFDETVIEGKNYLSCSWSNPMGNKTPNSLGTGKGLDAILEDLRQLNDTDSVTNSMLITRDDEQFQVTMFFQKDLLIDEVTTPTLRRKIKTE